MRIATYLLTLTTLLFLGACAGAGEEGRASLETNRPNILFILTDDQGIGDLSLHGNDSIRTPNMDALLRSGAKFNRFYVSPVCAPTRASFLSGMYHPRTGAVFVTRRRETMDDEIKTIPEYLREAGYRTGLFGKWHNGATKPYDPAGQGFDEFLGFTLGHFNDYFNGELENEKNEVVPFSGDLTDILTDTAAAFMLADSDQPFFTMLTYQAPHTPVQVADDHWAAVKSRGLTDYNTGIYAMIESIDEQIGRLLDELEAAGKLANTLVIFSTDNGPNGDRYRMGLKGTKGHVDEGGVRVPFAIRFPGNHPANGKEFNMVASHIDLLPTLLDHISLKVPEGIDGISLLARLAGKKGGLPHDDRYVYTFKQGYDFTGYPGSMRDGRYLLVAQAPERFELYDLMKDPGQTDNLLKHINEPIKVGLNDIKIKMMRAYQRKIKEVAPAPGLIAPPINLDAATGQVHLLAHEGEPQGQTTFNDEYGWANDWFVNLDANGAAWPIEVSKDRAYTATIHYNSTGNTHRTVRISSNEGQQFPVILAPFAGEQLPVADRTKRKEVYPRTWAKAVIKNFVVPAGSQELRISTDAPPGISIKEITLLPAER